MIFYSKKIISTPDNYPVFFSGNLTVETQIIFLRNIGNEEDNQCKEKL